MSHHATTSSEPIPGTGPIAVVSTLARFLARHPASRGARAASWWRAVRWQLGYRTGARRALVECAGTKLYVYPGSTGASGVLYVGLPEWDEMNFMMRFLTPRDHFGDVGANIGSYTLLASSRHPGVRVTAVEPGEPALSRFRENLALNGLSKVHVVDAALGPNEGVAQFTRGRDTVNRLAVGGDHEVVSVRMLTLDALFADDPPALIKMDVEGAEHLVLQGGARLLAAAAAPVLLFEWLDEVAGEFGVTGEMLQGMLEAHGYRLAIYDADTNTLTPWRVGQPTHAHNRVAAKDMDAVAERLARGRASGVDWPVAVRLTLERGE